MFHSTDMGDNLEEMVETEDCKVLRMRDPSGDGLMLNSAGTTIRQNQTIVNVAMAELMLAMAATVKAHTTSMNTAVVQMMVGFSTTIRSNGASVRTAMQSVMLVVVAEVNNYKDQFNEAGRNVSQGFINGIRSKLSGASQAGRDLGLAALNAAKMSDEAIKVAQKGLDSFKDWAEERKYYSELSLKEELAGWETLQKKYREGSEERKHRKTGAFHKADSITGPYDCRKSEKKQCHPVFQTAA